jgi:transposase
MNEWPLTNFMLIINKALIHKVAGICEMVEEYSVCLLYLPAYSPNFNLIKLVFSTIKVWLHET